MQKTVTIFGTSKAEPGDEVYSLAGELGQALASAGFAIANGGYGGAMLAASEGASKAGGTVYGVTCTAFGRKGPNEFVTEHVSTDTLQARLAKLIDIGDAYVVLRGSTGTLLELAEVWELKNKRFLNSDIPIILLGQYWHGLLEIIASADAAAMDCITVVDSAGDAVEIIKRILT